MKKYNIIAAMALGAGALAGCADTDIDVYQVEKPQSVADYEYLDNYAELKSYIDRSAHPNFLLGTGVGVADYNQKGLVYMLTNNNFDIMTAGNAMKYASVVGDDGSMNFNTVSEFVDNAEKAGVQIYGHTFCWHEQQNVKYLNRLIRDRELEVDPDASNEVEDAIQTYAGMTKFPYFVMGYEPAIIDGILTVSEYPGGWYQFFVADGLQFVEGREYKVTAKIRGSKPGSLNVQLGNWGALQEGKLEFTDEWSEASVKMAPMGVSNGFSVFQPGTYDGKLEIEWVKISHEEAPAIEVENEVTNKTYTDGPFPFYAMGCEPPVIDGCIHYVPDGGWHQFFILPGGENKLTEGNYVLYLDITSSKDASSGIQLTIQNGWGGDAQSVSTGVPVNAGQNTVRLKFNDLVGGDYDVILKPQTCDATLDVRSVRVCKVESMNTIPLTPEEKAEILEAEMERWIKGMMAATRGYVKAWDVVNEAISGGGGSRYDLQHAANDPNASTKFYWQDYLGDDFVRIPVKYARQYFEENGGNPDDLKLFINDYNLESDWDDNKKLKSLIEWINQWESDGMTKIDGIGSQLHISYYMNPETQKSKSEHVVKMLELMAATGKLVRITEFDMGLVDENGNDIPTAEVTLEQHKLMSDYYKFIIRKYFEIVPVAQQFGITFWCQTDAPENSGWRANQPVGIWDSGYNRKPAYAGIAEGLADKE